MFKIICLGITLSLASASFAMVEKTLDEKHPIDLVLSTHSHNRIAVEGGAVEKVFGDSSLFSVNIDPATGNAFVHVLRETGEQPAILTIVTSSGSVQDLTIRSSDGPSEQLLLKEEEGEKWELRPEVSHASTVDLLNRILEGSAPQGYGAREWEEKDLLALPEPLAARGVKVFEGPFETIRVYEIGNSQEKPIVLGLDALKKEGDAWVFLNLREIKHGEKAICMIGRAKE